MTKIGFGVRSMYPYYSIGSYTSTGRPHGVVLEHDVVVPRGRGGGPLRLPDLRPHYDEKEIARIDVPRASGAPMGGETSLTRWIELTRTYQDQMECIREAVRDRIREG
jgi:hypothetical protein